MINIEALSDAELDEIIDGSVDGVYPTSQEVSMAMELKARRSLTAQEEESDYFARLVTAARVTADKAMRNFPQPNYVLNKVAEEHGEVIKAVIHYTEGREEWVNVEGELIDNLAMLIRLVIEGDQVIGFTPPDVCRGGVADISDGECHEKPTA